MSAPSQLCCATRCTELVKADVATLLISAFETSAANSWQSWEVRSGLGALVRQMGVSRFDDLSACAELATVLTNVAWSSAANRHLVSALSSRPQFGDVFRSKTANKLRSLLLAHITEGALLAARAAVDGRASTAALLDKLRGAIDAEARALIMVTSDRAASPWSIVSSVMDELLCAAARGRLDPLTPATRSLLELRRACTMRRPPSSDEFKWMEVLTEVLRIDSTNERTCGLKHAHPLVWFEGTPPGYAIPPSCDCCGAMTFWGVRCDGCKFDVCAGCISVVATIDRAIGTATPSFLSAPLVIRALLLHKHDDYEEAFELKCLSASSPSKFDWQEAPDGVKAEWRARAKALSAPPP